MDTFTLSILLSAIMMGSIIGAIPAICGAIKGKIGYAVGGFFACLAAHFVLGLILSIPACAVFLYLIFKREA